MLDHPNVIKVVGHCQELRAIVFPYVAKGNLRDRLDGEMLIDGAVGRSHTSPIKRLVSIGSRVKIARSIAAAVSYMHERFIIHGDIKSHNVLIDKNLKPILCDFEMSLHFNPEQPLPRPVQLGTIGYIEPGFDENGFVDVSFDVYSFGVLLMEILSGFAAYEISGGVELFLVNRMVNQIQLDDYIKDKGKESVREEAVQLFQLCQRCTAHARDQRPSMALVYRDLDTIYNEYHK